MNINKIRLSGTTYNIQDENATKTVELTQAEYDSLAVKDPNTFYIITDATAGDLSNYYTKSETSGATEISTALNAKADTATTYTKTEVDNALANKADSSAVTEAINSAVSGKADTSAVTESINAAVSGKADTSSVYTKSEVDTVLGGKQATLVSGTNIKTINNESILGSGNITIEGGGGKAINAGRGISVTTGETADTVSFNLPISGLPKTTTAVTDNNLVIFGTGNTVDIESKTNQNLDSNIVYGNNNVLTLTGIKCSLQYNTIFGQGNEIANNASLNASSNNNFVFGSNNKVYGNNNKYNFFFGDNNQIQRGNIHLTVFGTGNNPQNQYETIFGKYSVSHTGSTNADKSLFSVGNGTADNARHNAFEIRQNGDIYLNDGSKLQDTITATAANTTALGGLKLVKLTQSEYDALSTKDSNTLFVIVN